MSDLFEDMASEAADLSAVPTEENSARLRRMGLELVTVDRTVGELEDQLKAAKARRIELTMKEMPALMQEIGQDRIGLPDARCDLVLEPYYHANIAKEWEEDRRTAAFDHLEHLGAGDLIKAITTIAAGRGDLDKMRELLDQIRELMQTAGLDAKIGLELTVPWNTLTAFVREQVEAGNVVDLEALGATVGTVVKIKQRKDK